jgi:hypothetical protein
VIYFFSAYCVIRKLIVVKQVVLWTDINKEMIKGTKGWGKEAAPYLWIANL